MYSRVMVGCVPPLLCHSNVVVCLSVALDRNLNGGAGNLYLLDDSFDDNIATNGAAVYAVQSCGQVTR